MQEILFPTVESDAPLYLLVFVDDMFIMHMFIMHHDDMFIILGQPPELPISPDQVMSCLC